MIVSNPLNDKSLLSNINLWKESVRLQTFDKWPNDPAWACSPLKLAKAGFYHNPGEDSPDNVCCAFCAKELDGWEPDDNPVAEHKSHSKTCPFLKLKKPVGEMTLAEGLKFYKTVIVFLSKQSYDLVKKTFQEQAKEKREHVASL